MPTPNPREASYALTPSFGFLSARYLRVLAELARQELGEDQFEFLDSVRAGLDIRASNSSELKFAFLVSLLADVASVGGSILIRDSVPHVAWPVWNSETVQASIRETMRKRFGDFLFSQEETEIIRTMFLPDMSPRHLEDIAFTGTFRLRRSQERHSSGLDFSRAFGVGIKTWSMPYRGREGRSQRFLLTVDHHSLSTERVVGLLEVGDDAPISGHRDRLLNLTKSSVTDYFSSINQQEKQATSRAISERFQRLRRALILPDKYLAMSAHDILGQRRELEAIAHGRSTSGVDAEKRALTYLVRLAAGEIAFAQAANGKELDEGLLTGGVRALHNITLPRIHAEITVCGAVPPFSDILGGKAVTAMSAHPAVRQVTAGGIGQILRETFQPSLSECLPDSEVILLTTKGLYPGHASIYNRALVPNNGGSLKFGRVGLTKGDTTAMLSDETARIALALQSLAETGKVSRAFGSGGGKRHRTIVAAARAAGLPTAFASTGIQRPVYALPLLRNTFNVVWMLESPSWQLEHTASESKYEEAAISLWRTRWNDQIRGRLRTKELHLGLESQRSV